MDISAGLGILPAMNRNSKGRSCKQTGDEGRHSREQKRIGLQIVRFYDQVSNLDLDLDLVWLRRKSSDSSYPDLE